MCGFIGIIGPENTAQELYTAMLLLQHRGQDAAGILTFDSENFHLRKNIGLVNEIFNEINIHELTGNIGIGHVRYPTVGQTKVKDAQPIQTGYPYGIGMAHNGNLLNYNELKKELIEKRHRQIRSTCDVEIILKLFADELSKIKHDVFTPKVAFKALKETMMQLNGSYSAVTLIGRKGLLAFCDPSAIRPIIMGEKEIDGKKCYAFVSESVALDALDYKVVRDLEPGEAIFVDMNGNLTSKIIIGKGPHPCMFEWVYFARPDSVIKKKGVYEVRLELGRLLAEVWKEKNIDIDVVIPVPTTSRTAALTFANEIGKPYREGLVKNRYIGRTFIMPSQEQRKNAVKMKLNPVILELKGKRVALIDDSIVRGTTSKKIIEMVRKAGAKEVHFLSTCPPIKYPCYWAIDMPTHQELIASKKEIKEIREYIGTDSLTYQKLENVPKAIGFPENKLCMACLNGKTPTPVSKDAKEILDITRKKERGEC